MNLRRIFAVTKRVFKDIKNDRRTIGLILIAPIFAMFVFGLAFSGNVEDIPVVVVNHDKGFQAANGENIFLSDKILSNFDNETLKIEYMDDEDKAISKVKDGDAYAVIIFTENFTKNAYLGIGNLSPSSMHTLSFPPQAQITIKDDESITTIKNSIIGAVQDAITKTMEEDGMNFLVKVTQDAIYAKDADFIDSFVPGIMAFVVFLLATLLTLLSFVGERVSGTLDRLMATPLQESEIVFGYALAFGVIGMIQAAFLLAVAVIVFNIMIIGNVFLAFLVVALLAVVSQALGILLSSLARREGQVIQFIPFIILPAFLLSGVFWPIEAIPRWLRPFSYMVPPTYAVDACRAIMLKGWGISKIWPNISALVLFAIFFLIVAVWSLKRGKD